MKDRIQEAFDSVRACEELKESTRAFLARKTRGFTRGKAGGARYAFSAAACLILMLAGGWWLYFVPTAQISIDVNPSIELGVNRFDRVVSVQDYNSDGRQLADSLNLTFLDYTGAVSKILENEQVAALLERGEVMTIAVVGAGTAQCERILASMESCTAEEENAYCYFAQKEEVAAAHQAGLSYGKYRAFLEAQALDPSLTPQDVKDMSMRQIRDLIQSLSEEGEEEAAAPQGQGKGGRGQRNRRQEKRGSP